MKHVIFILAILLGLSAYSQSPLFVVGTDGSNNYGEFPSEEYSEEYTSEWGGYVYDVAYTTGNIEVRLNLEDSSSFKFITTLDTQYTSRTDSAYTSTAVYKVTSCLYTHPSMDITDFINSPVTEFRMVEKGKDSEYPLTWQELHIVNESTLIKAFK